SIMGEPNDPNQLSASASGPPGLTIKGVASEADGEDSASVLNRLIRAQRLTPTTKLTLSKDPVERLTGKDNWLIWRTQVVATFSRWCGGRLWFLLLNHPATSVSSYRKIFSAEGGNEISVEEAMDYRLADIYHAGSILVNMIDKSTHSDVNRHVKDSGINGQDVWATLVTKYAGRDIATMQAAEASLASFTLGNRSVLQVSQDLEHLFTTIHLSGGDPVSEQRKVGIVLRVFHGSRFDSTRAALQNDFNRDKGTEINFDYVISCLSGEEAMSPSPPPESTSPASGTGSTALSAQAGSGGSAPASSSSAASQSSSAPTRGKGRKTRGGNRINNSRRQNNNHGGGGNGADTGCWWCTQSGHRKADCHLRRGGHPPHKDSRCAKEQQQASGDDAPGTISARLAAIESALMTSGRFAFPPPVHFGYAPTHHSPYGNGALPSASRSAPSLASRISDQHALATWPSSQSYGQQQQQNHQYGSAHPF
ncbi:hypothetical protein OC844_007454, partial [Tilletia horrida]